MKNIFTLSAYLLVLTSIQGQGFLDGNPEWHIRVSTWPPNQVSYSLIYTLGRDTTIDNKVYNHLLVTSYSDSSIVEKTGDFIRESNDSVFYKDGNLDELLYLLDNGLQPIYFIEHGPCELYSTDIDTIVNSGVARQITSLESSPQGAIRHTLISGVGYEMGMF